jgi:hypothetical protein
MNVRSLYVSGKKSYIPVIDARYVVGEDDASATDKYSMGKAMRCKAASNLDSQGITNPPKSFLSVSTPNISAKLNGVGVSLGSNFNDIVVSTKALRHMELDRLTDTSLIDEEEELHASNDGQLLSHLIGEVSEVDFDEAMLDSVYEFKASGRKSKSSSTKKNVGSRKNAKIIKSTIDSI